MNTPAEAPAMRIRAIQPEDFDSFVGLVIEMAETLGLTADLRIVGSGDASVRRECMRTALFGPSPLLETLILSVDGEAAGFCTFHTSFSTYQGMPGLFLEDLFVRPVFQKGGYGRQLMIRLAQIACERECFRIVWNYPPGDGKARRFYTGLGAQEVDRRTMIMEGTALMALEAPGNG